MVWGHGPAWLCAQQLSLALGTWDFSSGKLFTTEINDVARAVWGHVGVQW